MPVSARHIESIAQSFRAAAGALTEAAATLRNGTADQATIAGQLRSSGHEMLANLPGVQQTLPAGQQLVGLTDALHGAIETTLVRAGQFEGRPAQSTTVIANELEAIARHPLDAARMLEMEAYYARAVEGSGPRGALDNLAIQVTRTVPIPDADGQARELATLHALRASRTPSETARAITFSKFGDGEIWDEYLRLYELSHTPAEAARARSLVHQAIDRVIESSEAIKTHMPRQRPFDADPSLSTVINRPSTFSYLSGHTARARAAATVLETLWPERSAEFRHIADWVGESRLYGGVHYPSDVDAGHELGKRIARQVLLEHRVAPEPTILSGQA